MQSTVCAKEKATTICCDWTARNLHNNPYAGGKEWAQKRGQTLLTTGRAGNSMETKENMMRIRL